MAERLEQFLWKPAFVWEPEGIGHKTGLTRFVFTDVRRDTVEHGTDVGVGIFALSEQSARIRTTESGLRERNVLRFEVIFHICSRFIRLLLAFLLQCKCNAVFRR